MRILIHRLRWMKLEKLMDEKLKYRIFNKKSSERKENLVNEKKKIMLRTEFVQKYMKIHQFFNFKNFS